MEKCTLIVDLTARAKRQVSQQFEPGRDPYNTLDRWNQDAQDRVVFGEWVAAGADNQSTESRK